MSQSPAPGAPEDGGPGLAVAAAPTPLALWHDRNFLTFWSGQAMAQLGAQVTEIALPVIAVLMLQATELEVGYLNAAGVAAFLVVGLPAGAWIDRMRKRRVMMVADAVRILALGLIPVLWAAGALAIWHLIGIALVLGLAGVFFDVAYQSLVPALVPTRQIAEANGKLESTAQLAGVVGPSAGGWLVGAVAPPLAILTTTATYAVSLLALSRTRDEEVLAPRHEREPLLRSIREGVVWVFGNPLLRRIVGTTATSNLFSTVTFTLLPIFLLRDLGFSAAAMGVVLAAGSVGGLAGAMATARIVAVLGEGRAIPLSAVAFSIAGLLLPLAAVLPGIAFPLLIGQGFLGMFTVLVYNIVQVTFRQRITPPRLLGRMNASIRFVVWGVMPIAALAAGAMGAAWGAVTTIWIGAFGGLASALFVVIGPFWTMRVLPDPGDR